MRAAAGARRRPAERPAARAAGRPRPTLPAPRSLLVALAGVLLAVLTSWPLVLHLSSRIAPDLGDPVRTAWQIAWVGHAMLHDPLHLFDSNAFYPHPLSLAFSDSLLGYGPTAFFGSGTVAALVRYNLLFLLAWSLCFFGAYLLARELGLRRLGGAAAGLAFAYAPYRVTEAGHLHVISSGGIALALFLLLRGYRRDSRKLVLAGWLVSAWQVSLGFTLGLQYCLPARGARADRACAGGAGASRRARRGRQAQPLPQARPGGDRRARARRHAAARPRAEVRPLIPRRLLAVTLHRRGRGRRRHRLPGAPVPAGRRPVPDRQAHDQRSRDLLRRPAALLARLLGEPRVGSLTSGMRAKVNSKNESVFFPGGLILVLALVGLFAASTYTRRLRIGLLLGIVVCSILALGLGLTRAGYPYRLLYDSPRAGTACASPGRIFTLATLVLRAARRRRRAAARGAGRGLGQATRP